MSLNKLTQKESKLLEAIKIGMDEAGCGWLHEITAEGKKTSGLVSSLVKKGLITSEESFDYAGEYWVSVV